MLGTNAEVPAVSTAHVLRAVDEQAALNAVRAAPLPEDYKHLSMHRTNREEP